MEMQSTAGALKEPLHPSSSKAVPDREQVCRQWQQAYLDTYPKVVCEADIVLDSVRARWRMLTTMAGTPAVDTAEVQARLSKYGAELRLSSDRATLWMNTCMDVCSRADLEHVMQIRLDAIIDVLRWFEQQLPPLEE